MNNCKFCCKVGDSGKFCPKCTHSVFLVNKHVINAGQILSFHHDIVSKLPRGPYTFFRTICFGTSILFLEKHMQRLRDSVIIMQKSGILMNDIEMDPRWLETGSVTNLLVPHIQKALAEYTAKYPDDFGQEKKILIHLAWGHSSEQNQFMEMLETIRGTLTHVSPRISLHITKLITHNFQGIHVKAVLSHRNNPKAKDSQWSKSRKEFGNKNSINDYLICETNGDINEGSSSNFFAVENNTVYTSPNVLEGTIRGVVLDYLKEENISLVFIPPNILQSHVWSECFITSTSRLLLPICNLKVSNALLHNICDSPTGLHKYKVIPFSIGPIAKKLRQRLETDIDCSTGKFATRIL